MLHTHLYTRKQCVDWLLFFSSSLARWVVRYLAWNSWARFDSIFHQWGRCRHICTKRQRDIERKVLKRNKSQMQLKHMHTFFLHNNLEQTHRANHSNSYFTLLLLIFAYASKNEPKNKLFPRVTQTNTRIMHNERVLWCTHYAQNTHTHIGTRLPSGWQ